MNAKRRIVKFFFFNANAIVAVLLPQDKIRSGFESAI